MPTVNIACRIPQGVCLSVYNSGGTFLGAINLVGAPTNPPLATLAPGKTYPPSPQVPVTFGVDQTLWNTYAQMNAGSPMLVNGVVYQT